jgi:hypothetical protein
MAGFAMAQMRKALGAEGYQIDYIIRKLGIEPIGRFGQARVFDQAAVDRVGEEIRRIAEVREEQGRRSMEI